VSGIALAYDLEQDPAIFDGQGDRQFDVYRAMREAVAQDWNQTALQTNALWLDYLVDKLLTAKTYKSRAKREAKVGVPCLLGLLLLVANSPTDLLVQAHTRHVSRRGVRMAISP
jgi:hypothetical protein